MIVVAVGLSKIIHGKHGEKEKMETTERTLGSSLLKEHRWMKRRPSELLRQCLREENQERVSFQKLEV